jgi:uracil-DNA glycosylase
MAASEWNPLQETDWNSLLEEESEKEYWACLRECIEQERSCYPDRVYPPADKVFGALRLTQCGETRVAIVGQDPYHSHGLADGLAFSVPRHVRKQQLPPSLRNILRALREDPELPEDVRSINPGHGNLAAWARRGVLLLNSGGLDPTFGGDGRVVTGFAGGAFANGVAIGGWSSVRVVP